MTDTDVFILGAGFSGICAAHFLKEAGRHDFVVAEKAPAPGGTWRDNTYPGLACDVPSLLYSFSFAPNPDWSRFFAPQAEIYQYIENVIQRTGIGSHIQYGVRVETATWNDEEKRWHIATSAGPFRARVIISGAGPWHEPRIPDIEGLSSFAGEIFHSSRWNHDFDLTGKRVAVIGSGASAVQFVPEIAPKVAALHLFQRTAHWVIPKPDAPNPAAFRWLARRIPAISRVGATISRYVQEALGVATRHPKMLAPLQRAALWNMHRSIKDPALRAILTPDYVIGCKRLLLSNQYYKGLLNPSVKVIPHGVTQVRPNSVIGADGIEREVDAIILGTGYKVLDQPIAQMVTGRDGLTLDEVWQGSPRGYLGTMVSRFPNLFILLGPNLGNGHSSATLVMEQQMRYIMKVLTLIDETQAQAADVRPQAQALFNSAVDAAIPSTVWNAGGCASYYLDRNGRNSFMYPWSTMHYDRATRTARLADFSLESAQPAQESIAS